MKCDKRNKITYASLSTHYNLMTAPGLLRVEAIQNAGQDDEEGRQATILRRAGRRHKWNIFAREAIRR